MQNSENTEEIIAKYAIDADLFRLGSSILKHAGPRGAAPVGGEAQKKVHIFAKCETNQIKFFF